MLCHAERAWDELCAGWSAVDSVRSAARFEERDGEQSRPRGTKGTFPGVVGPVVEHAAGQCCTPGWCGQRAAVDGRWLVTHRSPAGSATRGVDGLRDPSPMPGSPRADVPVARAALLALLVVGATHAQPADQRLFHVLRDTYGCSNPRATLALTNRSDPRLQDPGWVAFVVADGHCAPITPRSPWRLLSLSGELSFMAYAGTTGLPGSFYLRTAELVELPPAPGAPPAVSSQPVTEPASPPPPRGTAPAAVEGPTATSPPAAPSSASPSRAAAGPNGYANPPEAMSPPPGPRRAPAPVAPPSDRRAAARSAAHEQSRPNPVAASSQGSGDVPGGDGRKAGAALAGLIMLARFWWVQAAPGHKPAHAYGRREPGA